MFIGVHVSIIFQKMERMIQVNWTMTFSMISLEKIKTLSFIQILKLQQTHHTAVNFQMFLVGIKEKRFLNMIYQQENPWRRSYVSAVNK